LRDHGPNKTLAQKPEEKPPTFANAAEQDHQSSHRALPAAARASTPHTKAVPFHAPAVPRSWRAHAHPNLLQAPDYHRGRHDGQVPSAPAVQADFLPQRAHNRRFGANQAQTRRLRELQALVAVAAADLCKLALAASFVLPATAFVAAVAPLVSVACASLVAVGCDPAAAETFQMYGVWGVRHVKFHILPLLFGSDFNVSGLLDILQT